jgi:hypothetical protein
MHIFHFPPFFLKLSLLDLHHRVHQNNKVNAEQYKMKFTQYTKDYKFSGFFPHVKLRLKTTP